MPLEDVVQGVSVNVTTDGVDDAKAQLAGLDKAIEDLSKTAEAATGGGRGGGSGIAGLSKAFSDLSMVGADAFANIARSATSGDLTGIATLFGGPVAGSFVQAGKALGEFIQQQDAVILSNASMAKELGTTPQVVQGLKEGFESAVVSAGGFQRLVSQVSRQTANDYSSMMRNIRTDNDTQEKASLRLEAAQEKLQQSYGVPKEAFAAQDKLREQKENEIAVNEVLEQQRELALKSIPHITQALKESAEAHQQNADIADTDMNTLRKSIENLARGPGGGQADPLAVLKKEFELIQSGAIGTTQAIALLQTQLGMRAGAGIGGMDAAILAANPGAALGAINKAQSGKTGIQQLGLGISEQDVQNATDFGAELSKVSGLFQAMGAKGGSKLSGSVGTPFLKEISDFLEKTAGIFTGHTGLKSKQEIGKEINEGDFWGGSGLKNLVGARSPYGTSSETERAMGGPTPGHIIWSIFDTPEERARQEKLGGMSERERVEAMTPRFSNITPSSFLNSPLMAGIGAGVSATGSVAGSVADFALGGGGNIKAAGDAVVQALLDVASGIRSAATGAPPSAAAAPGQWQGGPIRFAGGGAVRRVPGFAAGGLLGAISNVAGTAWNAASTGSDDARDQLNSFLAGHFATEFGKAGVGAGLRSLGIGAGEAALRTVAGAFSNPFGTGILDASETGAADATSGAAQEEALGRAMGATNALEASKLLMQGAGMQLAGGGSIPGFAGGGMATAQAELQAAEQDLAAFSGPDPGDKRRRQLQHRVDIARAKVQDLQAVEAQARQQAKARQEMQDAQQAFAKDKADVALSQQLGSPKSLDWTAGKTAADYLGGGSGYASGGFIPGFATGSIRGPGTGTSDSILARLSNGEFVMKDAAVRTYGEGFMHAINNMQIPPPKYEHGGMVPVSSLPRFAEGGHIERPGSILNLHVGGEVFSGLKAPAAVADQLRKFAINQQTTSTGRKPSWST